MKRGVDDEEESSGIGDEKGKRRKGDEEEGEETSGGLSNLGQDLLFEVLKHADARTLGVAGCVNKQWNKTAQDERLWEMICTRHWATSGTGAQQLRSVVLALGGFRRLHSLYHVPTVKPLPASSTATTTSPAPPSLSSFAPSVIPSRSKMPTHWGKDEVHLSLSLLSIRFYETMCPNNPKISSSSSGNGRSSP